MSITKPRCIRKQSLILQCLLWDYKSVDPLKKHKKAIPSKLVFHIYRKQHSHLRTAIGQLIAGDFLFGMKSCKYFATPKGENKQTYILRKGGIRFYSKQRGLPHSSGCIHLADKVSPTFRAQKNGFKNATVIQWCT